MNIITAKTNYSNTTKDDHDDIKFVSDFELDINLVLSVLITFVTIPSNLILILIYFNCRKLQNLNNTAITMLSCTDLLRGCVVMTMKIHNQFYRIRHLGWFTCHLTALICAFSFVFSPLMLALISFVRYCKISFHSTKRRDLTPLCFYLISAVLFFSALLFSVLPYIGVGDYRYSQSHGVCFANWDPVNTVFRSIFYVIVIGIAFPVLTVSYATLYWTLRKHNRQMLRPLSCKSKEEPSVISRCGTTSDSIRVSHDSVIGSEGCTNRQDVRKNTGLLNISTRTNMIKEQTDRKKEGMVAVICETEIDKKKPNSPKQNSLQLTSPRYGAIEQKLPSRTEKQQERENNVMDSKKKKRSRHEYRVTQLLILIFIAYIVCWFPAALVNVISLTHWHYIPEFWYYIIVTLVELKSALDPVIYGLGNEKYRKGFKSILKQFQKWLNLRIGRQER